MKDPETRSAHNSATLLPIPSLDLKVQLRLWYHNTTNQCQVWFLAGRTMSLLSVSHANSDCYSNSDRHIACSARVAAGVPVPRKRGPHNGCRAVQLAAAQQKALQREAARLQDQQDAREISQQPLLLRSRAQQVRRPLLRETILMLRSSAYHCFRVTAPRGKPAFNPQSARGTRWSTDGWEGSTCRLFQMMTVAQAVDGAPACARITYVNVRTVLKSACRTVLAGCGKCGSERRAHHAAVPHGGSRGGGRRRRCSSRAVGALQVRDAPCDGRTGWCESIAPLLCPRTPPPTVTATPPHIVYNISSLTVVLTPELIVVWQTDQSRTTTCTTKRPPSLRHLQVLRRGEHAALHLPPRQPRLMAPQCSWTARRSLTGLPVRTRCVLTELA